ncbi:hypothetical protein [Spiroplasma endosymbiont of Atherix ibis]|uniref:hypothetical protein n=1 Tax=Spiroplasma endosymbiont of Atherix ibis TaxID=3066291 RepID=UPI0030CD1561
MAKLNIVKTNSRLGFAFKTPSSELIDFIEKKLDFNKDVFKKMIHKDALEYRPKGYNRSSRYICNSFNTIINNSRDRYNTYRLCCWF